MATQSPQAEPQPTAQPARFGLLGRTLGHSWSPRIHSTLGSAPYALFEREPSDVADFVRNGSWQGINVTIPYKRDAAALADEQSERVRRLGVANTLVRRADGSIYADNTDVLGFSFMLDRFARRHLGARVSASEVLAGKKALVLGTGGASQAVQASLEDAGAQVVAISRTGTETYATLTSRHADAALLVNTTPVGMFPKCPASPISADELAALTGLVGVLDVVYNPERTGLMLDAARLGLPCESGLAMLVAQAFFASQLFQGAKLEQELVDTIEQDIRKETRNVVFIGMPGCGKSAAGRKLARLTRRPFVDLDDSFAIDHGITPAACITERGEAAFRELETQTAADYCARSGLVIACGGGIVTQPRNFDILHQNSTVVMLDRNLEELSSDGRPLSQAKGIEALAAERMPLYRSWADIVLPCTGSSHGDAVAVRDLVGW
ncbi:MAG: shikimate kinase [Coriobacteriales bacterium]|nr:shikimate kinase [Coriobacteriales bacterium]